jgi:hypothetical protein
MKYTQVKNPIWANAEHTVINCEVDFYDLKEEFVQFSAVASGDYEHSHQIFAECMAGKYGEIAEFKPYIPTTEELAQQVRGQRNALLQELDSIVGNPLRWASFSTEQQTELANYRQALLDVPQQTDFPDTVDFPVKPTILG